jgi:hypothetical protein
MDCYGIVMEKRDLPAKPGWEVTKCGTLRELKLVKQHNDAIVTILDKSSYRADERATLFLINTITLQLERAKIYQFSRVA